MILFFIIGLVFIGLGIFAKVHSNRMYKLGLKSAMVLDCQPKTKTIGTKEVPCSEVTLEFYTCQGTIQKTIIDNGKYFVGDTISIYYDPDKDRVELPKNISKQDDKGPYMVMAFGFMISALCVLVAVSRFSAPVREVFYTGLAYFVAVGLILGGLFLAVIRPMRRKRVMPNCRKVPGKLVDYRTHSGSSSSIGRLKYVYEPIYEFYYNGEMVRIDGEMSSSGERFRQIGKDVTIVINDMTGEKYCLDDVTEIKKSAVFCLIFGVVLLVLLISIDFNGSDRNNTESTNSTMQLELEP